MDVAALYLETFFHGHNLHFPGACLVCSVHNLVFGTLTSKSSQRNRDTHPTLSLPCTLANDRVPGETWGKLSRCKPDVTSGIVPWSEEYLTNTASCQ
ncbi:hypothetical protein E2C01_064060 [Portunus trituberculatus]|uniref:Uncharacterized protein n=1 Tax=Portunus trituberculatus TaxID=210409 RepID=A0A5B7HJB8_PORTR|nr:hypothetical protein [Portunus trituberculatus]